MTSILDRLKAQKEKAFGIAAQKELLPDKRPPSQQVKPSDINTMDFRGLGLTKREMEKSDRQYEREVKRSIEKGGDIAADEARDKFAKALDEITAALQEEARTKNIVLDDSQLEALKGILSNSCSVLIGAAGTGKTTITRMVINELAKRVSVIDLRSARFVTLNEEGMKSARILQSQYERDGEKDEAPSICGAAFTGRASQQFKRAVEEKWQRVISTIHSLLGYMPTFEMAEVLDPISKTMIVKEVMRFRPSFGANCKLPYTVYLLDEASMIPIPLFNELVHAMPKNSRVLLIGDIHQLPPVFGKSVLGYAMQKWPVFELRHIHRQAADNPIIANAHRILNGCSLQKSNQVILQSSGCPSGQGEMQVYIRQVVGKLAQLGHYDPLRDAIIVPQNVGMIGTEELNPHFVTMFNPERVENGVIINKRVTVHTGTAHNPYAVGDKVMMLSNINDVDPPITNGMIGIVEEINFNGRYDQKRSQYVSEDNDGEAIDFNADELEISLAELAGDKDDEKPEKLDQRQSSHVMTIRFDTGQVYTCSTAGDYRRVKHAYAITCHKAQGGEYPNVIIICHSANIRMLSREWLYTAFTRARNRVFLIHNDRGLTMALKNQKIKGNTIAQKIESYVIETQLDLMTGAEQDPFAVDEEKFPILFNPRKVV